MGLKATIPLFLTLLNLTLSPVSGAVSSSRSDHHPTYETVNLLDICPHDHSKKVVRLTPSKATVFALRVERLPSPHDFLCHLELEVDRRQYGFHVYFEEMNLVGNEGVDGCRDYIQFARDTAFLTVHKSPHFCGRRARINASNEEEVHRSYVGNQTRFYIEERDFEMDFMIKLDGSVPQLPRDLSVVVTIFKKSCSSSDDYFVECPNTHACIKKELFCDSKTNCAWPNGDVPSDEIKCDELSSGGSLSPANIPIIIIVAIVVLGLLMIFCIAMRTVWSSVKRRPAEGRQDRQRRPRGHRPEAIEIAPPLLRPSTSTEVPVSVSPPPSAPPGDKDFPPSYEEALTHTNVNVTVPSGVHPHHQPPPYSPS